MALRSVIDIDVDDSAFQRFAGMFRDYQDQVAKTAPAWQATSNAATKQTGALSQHVQLTTQIFQLQKRLGEQSEAQARNWFNMARDSKGFAQHITEATRQLLRWTSITTAISGLLGIGGLFGIDRLANSAFSQRRSALGLGMTTGEHAAFGLNFKRYIENPDQFLGGVNESLHDLTKRQPLYALGFNEQSLAGKDTAQVGVEALERIKKLADQATDDRARQQVIDAHKLGQWGINIENFRRLKDLNAGDITQYQADSRGLNLDAQTTKAWDNLKIQLDRAGTSIENTFIKGLVKLADPLAKLSGVFAHAVDAFMKSDMVREGIEHLGSGIEWLGKELESDEFHKGVKTFAEDVITLAKATGHAVHWLANIGGPQSPEDKKAWDEEEAKRKKRQDEWDKAHPGVFSPDAPAPPPADPQKDTAPSWLERSIDRLLDLHPSMDFSKQPDPKGQGIWDRLLDLKSSDAGGNQDLITPVSYRPFGGNSLYHNASAQSSFSDDICSCLRSATGGEGGMIHSAAFRPTMEGISPVAKGENVNEAHDFFRAAGWSEAQTAGLLGNINAESGFNPKATNETGHQGIAQWDATRAARFRQMFGHDPARGSLEEQLLYMQWELRHSEAEAGERLKRAMTPSQAAAAINESYERSGTPSGGRANAAEQYGNQFKDRSVTIKIQNNTGGNANVSVSALSV